MTTEDQQAPAPAGSTAGEQVKARGAEPSRTGHGPGPRPRVAATVDARGAFCPIPIIWMAERMHTLAPGEVLAVLATDEAILEDLPAWCRATGHAFLGFDSAAPVFRGYAEHRRDRE